MQYTKETMPYKLTLKSPKGKKYVFYKSVTEFIDFNEQYFTSEEGYRKTPQTDRQLHQEFDNKLNL